MTLAAMTLGGNDAKGDATLAQALLWRNGAKHAATVLLWRRFEFAVFEQLFDDAFHHATTLFNVSHLAATKEHRHLDFVLVLQKVDGPLHLEVDVVFARLGTKAYFLRLRVMRSAALLLALLVFVFAVIHDSANGRTFVRRYFDEIQFGFFCAGQRVFCFKYAELLPILRNHAHR